MFFLPQVDEFMVHSFLRPLDDMKLYVTGFGKTRHNAGVIIISNFLLYHVILILVKSCLL